MCIEVEAQDLQKFLQFMMKYFTFLSIIVTITKNVESKFLKKT